jgi:hypothetical protein
VAAYDEIMTNIKCGFFETVVLVSGVLLLSSSKMMAQEKLPIAVVFDIEAKRIDLDKELIDALTTHLSARIAELGVFQLIPRAELKSRLLQQKKTSYKNCYDQSCQIEMGRELAASKTISTTITKFGSKCNIGMSLYDLKKAATEKGSTHSGKCDEEALADSLSKAAVALVKVKKAQPPAKEAKKDPYVFSDLFDGQMVSKEKWKVDVTGRRGRVSTFRGKLNTEIAGRPWQGSYGKGSIHKHDIAGVQSHERWMLDGDFDLEVDFKILSLPVESRSGADTTVQICVFRDGWKNAVVLSRREQQGGGSVISFDYSSNGEWKGNSKESRSMQGRFRLLRNGNQIAGFLNSGMGYQQIGAASFSWGLSPVLVWIGVGRLKTNSEVTVEFDNFKINKGRIIPWGGL